MAASFSGEPRASGIPWPVETGKRERVSVCDEAIYTERVQRRKRKEKREVRYACRREAGQTVVSIQGVDCGLKDTAATHNKASSKTSHRAQWPTCACDTIPMPRLRRISRIARGPSRILRRLGLLAHCLIGCG